MNPVDFARKFIKFSLISNPILAWKIASVSCCSTVPLFMNPEIHRLKKEYLLNKYRHIFQKYDSATKLGTHNDGPIWFCWWQGEEQMIPLAKGCYNRLLDMKPQDKPVILLTKDNFRDYVNIPEIILKKLQRGKITITQFSDILRFCLLEQHGGLWVDATTWVTHPIKEEIFQNSFYTCRSTDPAIVDTKRVARGTDTPWLLASCSGSPIFSICREIFFEYWERHSLPFDYLLIDYCLINIYDNMKLLHQEMDAGADVQNFLFAMEPLLNEPFNEDHFAELSAKTPFYKLSYKMGGKPTTDRGELTYFGYFCQYERSI